MKKQNGENKENNILSLCLEYLSLENEKKLCDEKVKNVKDEIITRLLEKKQSGDEAKVTVELNSKSEKPVKIEFSAYQQRRVEYDEEKLKEILSKKILEKIFKKETKIFDKVGFVNCLKNHDLKFSEVKEFLETTEVLERKKIQALYESGELDLRKIKDAYKIKTNDVLRVKIDERTN